ncbi:MAG: glycoside hydrolase family 18 protein [Halanaerobiales bacterium]
MAYLPAWNGKTWTVRAIQGHKLTHLLLSFARIDNEFRISDLDVRIKGVPDTVSAQMVSEEAWAELKKVRKKYPHLKIVIAVGGWEGEGFSDMVATGPTREIFVDSVVEYIEKHQLDGVDLDWEFPVNGAMGVIKSRPEDRQNFTLLLQLLWEKLGKDKEISFCANGAPWFKEVVELEKVHPLVNSINVMAYDFYGPWCETTGHHANLYLNENDPAAEGGLSADLAVKRLREAGVPAGKIVLGVAAYGREFYQVEPGKEGNGLFQKHQGTIWRGGSVPYKHLKKYYINKNGFTRYWDEVAKAPFLYDGTTFISYDDQESIGEKCRYVKEQGLAGAMYWEYLSDADGELLTVIANSLNG